MTDDMHHVEVILICITVIIALLRW